MTTLAQSDVRADRSLIFTIEQGIEDILGCLSSIYLCQIAIESRRHILGMVRAIKHHEVVGDPPQRGNEKNNGEAASRVRSLVVLPSAESVSFYSRCLTAFRSSDKSVCYTGAAIHD